MQQISYEYAKRGANLVLVARRENRLRLISENARLMGAKHVTVIAADVVKEDECRRFVHETINIYGHRMSSHPPHIIYCRIHALISRLHIYIIELLFALF